MPNLFWIVVEDSQEKSELVTNLLEQRGFAGRSVQICAATPKEVLDKNVEDRIRLPRGVNQRNAGLQLVIKLAAADPEQHGIVYFMDDDNTYSLELFDEIQKIERGRIGVWPVGLAGGLMVERPLVNSVGLVEGFNAIWGPERDFSIDMAGFAISVDLILKYPKTRFSYYATRGHIESEFIKGLMVWRDELQPMADMCTKVLVWHTRTAETWLHEESKHLVNFGIPSNLGIEV